MEEFVILSNQNEEYSLSIYQCTNIFPTSGSEKIATRKDFKSKHFGRAETVCCAATTIIIIIPLMRTIYFKYLNPTNEN